MRMERTRPAPVPQRQAAEPRLERAAPAAASVPAGAKAPARAPVERRMPNLFARVTGAAFSRHAPSSEAAPAAAKPEASPEQPAARPAAPKPEATQPAAAQPTVQPRLTGLDPSDRIAASRKEEDLLDIPAFLRRQAN